MASEEDRDDWTDTVNNDQVGMRRRNHTALTHIVILGHGQHMRSMVELLRSARPDLRILGVLNDVEAADSIDALGVTLRRASLAELIPLKRSGLVYLALARGGVLGNGDRVALYERMKRNGFVMPALVHKTAVIGDDVSIGLGAQVYRGVSLGDRVEIGENTILDSGCELGEGSTVGPHSNIASGAVLESDVHVGENTLIGMGVTVYEGVQVGKDVVIASGCHVMTDVPHGASIMLLSNSLDGSGSQTEDLGSAHPLWHANEEDAMIVRQGDEAQGEKGDDEPAL